MGLLCSCIACGGQVTSSAPRDRLASPEPSSVTDLLCPDIKTRPQKSLHRAHFIPLEGWESHKWQQQQRENEDCGALPELTHPRMVLVTCLLAAEEFWLRGYKTLPWMPHWKCTPSLLAKAMPTETWEIQSLYGLSLRQNSQDNLKLRDTNGFLGTTVTSYSK